MRNALNPLANRLLLVAARFGLSQAAVERLWWHGDEVP